MRELRIGLIDVLNRYLEHSGWHSLHAGAVELNGRVLLIVGDSGAGKTTVIANLIREGAKYIGNERLFVRFQDEDCVVRAFPQTISVGLGTAANMPELAPLIDRPDHLSCYQHAFEPDRVWNTPQDQYAELPDKLKLLPSEMTSLLQATRTLSTAKIDAIVVPNINAAGASECCRLSQAETLEVLRCNYMPAQQDQLYPRYLPISNEYFATLDGETLIGSLAKLSAWQFSFTKEHRDYAGVLNDLLAKQ